MVIPKSEIEKMEKALESGATISEIARSFPKYNYWDIYYELSDYSLLGKKRSLTNRIKKLRKFSNHKQFGILLDEIGDLSSEIYDSGKKSGKRLRDIAKILEN